MTRPLRQDHLCARILPDLDAPERWDEAVLRLGGHVLQSTAWARVKGRHGWEPVWIDVMSDGESPLMAQVLFRTVGSFSVAYVPRGPLGPLCSLAAWQAFRVALDSVCRTKRAVIAFVEPEPGFPLLHQMNTAPFRRSSAEFQPLRSIKVSIDRSDDALLAQMKPKTRYNVRLALRRGVTIRFGGLHELPAFYELLLETSERDHFAVHQFEYYEDVLRQFSNRAVLLIAEIDSQVTAAVIVLRFGEEAIYMYGASSTAHQRDMPTYLVQYEAMRWARDAGCSVYDLWGIPETDQPPTETAGSTTVNVRQGLWGVYRFKQGFGGMVVDYPGVYERVYRPSLVWLWRRLKPGTI